MHEKPFFLFPNVPKRWSFQKKSNWNMIFLVLSEKMIFLFPEDRQKRKEDLSQKNAWKYVFFKFDGLCKKIAQEYEYFCNIWKDGISFFFRRKMNYLSAKKKQRQIHLKVTFAASLKKMIFILENMVFLLKYHVD